MHYSYSSNLLLSSPVPTAWPDTTKLNSTEIRQFFASRGVLNMFRTSWVESGHAMVTVKKLLPTSPVLAAAQ